MIIARSRDISCNGGLLVRTVVPRANIRIIQFITRAAQNGKGLLLFGVLSLTATLLCPQARAQNNAAGVNGITALDQKGINEDIRRHLGDVPADAGPKANLLASLNPSAVKAAVRKVAAWELDRMQPYFTRNWTFATLYTGLMAASRVTGDTRYKDAVAGMAKKFHWNSSWSRGGPRTESHTMMLTINASGNPISNYILKSLIPRR